MNRSEAKRVVAVVLSAIQSGASDEEIAGMLVRQGIDGNEALAVAQTIDDGFKAGVLSVAAGGLSHQDDAPAGSMFYDLAFDKGRSAMRFRTPFWVIFKIAVILLLVLLVVGLYIRKVAG